LTSQAASRYLCEYQDKGFFQLRPDMLVTRRERRWVLDAKWKRLDSSDAENRFGLSQSDFYQLFAYGQKYLDGKGDLFLIYPQTSKFSVPLGPFRFSDSMQLWALPFDLEAQELRLLEAASTRNLPVCW
jgi:5-methylcytosine-specific restriction enzyme subunit McrC